VANAGPNQTYALQGIETIIRLQPNLSFPHREREIWLFAQYSDGDGIHNVQFELVRQQLESEEVVMTFGLPPVHMTAGRFAILNRGYRLLGVPFPEPGWYEFRIRCGTGIAIDEIRLEESP
jgi:hypothetical protein